MAGPGTTGLPAWTGRGFAGNFYGLTAGLTWHPTPNLFFRPEVRWDWYRGRRGEVLGVAGRQPFDAGDSNDQFTFAADMVLTY